MKTLPNVALLALCTCWRLAAADADPAASLRAWRGDQPGGVVLALVDREQTRFFADGVFSRSDPRAPDADTFFEIGSVTKVFTALLLADAVHRGELKLDDTIAARAGVEASAAITFERLATHHAGLPQLGPGFTPTDMRDPYAHEDSTRLRASLARTTPREPGTRFEYSNFGAAVLGEAIAKTVGQPYAALLRTRVLQPLGMDATQLDWRLVDHNRLLPGHAEGKPTPNWTLTGYAPAGALVSNARDLAKLVQVALGFRESSLHAALITCLEPRADTEQSNMSIGLAWMVNRQGDGTTITWHNGGTGGYRSFVGFVRGAGRGVVLLTNHDTPLEALAFSLLANKPFASIPATPVEPPAPEFAPYVGRYPLAPSFVLQVTADGSQLFVQATGQSRLGLTRVDDDRFSVIGVDAQISFERDAGGAIAALVLHQNGRDQRAPRRDQDEPPRPEVTLEAATLAEYVGQYPVSEAMTLTVTVTNGTLFVEATGQPNLPVFAEARDRFFYKIIDAQLTFERGVDDTVTGLVLRGNGEELRGPKK